MARETNRRSGGLLHQFVQLCSDTKEEPTLWAEEFQPDTEEERVEERPIRGDNRAKSEPSSKVQEARGGKTEPRLQIFGFPAKEVQAKPTRQSYPIFIGDLGNRPHLQ